MKTIIEIEREIFSRLYGIPSWNVKRGYATFVTFDFGQPYLEINEKIIEREVNGLRSKRRMTSVYGEWHLWLYDSEWSISQGSTEICNSKSEDSLVDRGCTFLNGQAIAKISIEKEHNKTTIDFDLEGRVVILPDQDDREDPPDLWMLFCPNGMVFSLRSDGCFSYQRNNTVQEEERYEAIES